MLDGLKTDNWRRKNLENSLGTREITAKRLILRRFYSRDITCVCQNLIHDISVAKLFWGDEYANTYNIDSYFDRLQDLYSKPCFFLWAIQLCDEERIIGFIRADYNQNVNSAKLSFALELTRQNHGYMKEAISAVIPYLIEEVQVNRIEAFCDNQHRIANKVLIRCGFNVEGIKRQAGFSNGEIVDLISFAILKETYMRIKEYKNINIDDLWITNYRENGGERLKNIMRLPKDEAVKLASQLSTLTTSGNDRYGYYFERYYEKRQKTEEWLYVQFQKHGGNPQTKHPIYFVLCDSSSLERFYGQRDRVSIKLKDIPSEYLSFTPRDSMHLKDMGLLEGTVWSKYDFLGLLKKSDRGIGNMIVNLPGLYGQPGGYIEAHLWDDDYLKFAY